MDLPFTNIRQVLSLHNQVSPEKIFLTVISDKGRQELSYGEFSARCHQTANFLQEDLGIQPGDTVGVMDDNPDTAAVLIMACWLVGAAVAPYPYGTTDEQNDRTKAVLIRRHDSYGLKFSEMAKNPHFNGKLLVQLGDPPTKGYLHFDTLVRSMPNSFFNDHPEPTLDSPAYFLEDKDNKFNDGMTQGELLSIAYKLANQQFITGNQRLISYLKLSGFAGDWNLAFAAISIFLTVLLTGGSIILSKHFINQPHPDFWRLVAAERLHIGCLDSFQLMALHAYAKVQRAAGKPIYGEGIYQQDIKQLRHIYCPDVKGDDRLAQKFTAMFPSLLLQMPSALIRFEVITSSLL